MQFTSTIIYTLLSLAPLTVQADLELNEDDYSQACQSVCRPIHDLSDVCDVDGDRVGGQPTEDRLKLQCICTNNSFDVGSVAALCQSCMQQNPRRDDDDDNDDDEMEDINEIVSRCGFSAATYTPDQASSANSIIVNAARPTAASQLTTTVTGGGQTTATSSVTSTASGTTASGTTSETTGTGTSATSSGAAATSTEVTVSGASHLGSHPGDVGAMLLTCVIGAAGLGAWVI